MGAVAKGPATVSAGLSVRPGRGPSGATPTPYAQLVLDAVARIPRGGALSYGDVAEEVGRGSARTVGTALSRYGGDVPWQRVVQASGRPAEPFLQEALGLLRAEGCPLVGDPSTSQRVDLEAARRRVLQAG